jgi:hypothetical protein
MQHNAGDNRNWRFVIVAFAKVPLPLLKLVIGTTQRVAQG